VALIDIRDGDLGTVVTYLEMTERPKTQSVAGSPLRLEQWHRVDPARYRTLFRRIGGRWLWYSRLAMNDAALQANVAEVHAVVDGSRTELGMIELDFRQPGECLIRFLGLVPELAGRGHGRWLFAQMLALAWRAGVNRVHVNTCTLDHPAALPSYLRAGFRAYKRSFESFPDPRMLGLLPLDVSPQIPVVAGSATPARAR
jgi:GNAT superfamily N-acetyltransferase